MCSSLQTETRWTVVVLSSLDSQPTHDVYTVDARVTNDLPRGNIERRDFSWACTVNHQQIAIA